jgi:hypothetical protein
MAGASEQTQRVQVVNANWSAGEPGADGTFAFLFVTEDQERHTVEVSPAAASALVAMTQADTVLLWDPANQALIVGNLVGEWIPKDWTATGPSTTGDA